MLSLGFCATVSWADDPNVCDAPGEAPDVIVGEVSGIVRHGRIGEITSFSIGTTSCNVGTCQLNWFFDTNEHPVIGQNMFRIKDGRIEQIGQSWLKHGFAALDLELCSTGCVRADFQHLGVNCSDPYGAALNGIQQLLGPKFEINAATGEFPFPPTDFDLSGDLLYKRLQVHNDDLNPALNDGAVYVAEAQYVTADDAAAGNATNNASYREFTVLGSGGTYLTFLSGHTVRGRAGIQAWKDHDSAVTETMVDVPGDGRLIVAARAWPLDDGFWRYEYAIQNLNSHRAANEFRVPLGRNTRVRNVGFHDVGYHSGEPFHGSEWKSNQGSGSRELVWTTSTYAGDPLGNALRWGTLYNFSFEATAPPGEESATIGLFRPGVPRQVGVATIAPGAVAGGVLDIHGEKY